MKKLFFVYQRMMWYASQTGAEMSKPLRFYSETALLVILLKSFDIIVNWKQAIIFYLLIMIFAISLGKFLTRIGVVAYNNQLANQQNELLLKIDDRLKKIEEKIQ